MSRVRDLASKFAADPDLLLEEFQALMVRLSELYFLREIGEDDFGDFNFPRWLEPHFEVTDAMRTAFTVDLDTFARAANQSRANTGGNLPEIDVELFRSMSACIRGPWQEDIGHDLLELRDRLWKQLHEIEFAVDFMPRTPAAATDDSGGRSASVSKDERGESEFTDPIELALASRPTVSARYCWLRDRRNRKASFQAIASERGALKFADDPSQEQIINAFQNLQKTLRAIDNAPTVEVNVETQIVSMK
jgi:hypothetical protein